MGSYQSKVALMVANKNLLWFSIAT